MVEEADRYQNSDDEAEQEQMLQREMYMKRRTSVCELY